MTDTISCPHCREGQGDPANLSIPDAVQDGQFSRLYCFNCGKEFFVKFHVRVRYECSKHQPGHDFREARP